MQHPTVLLLICRVYSILFHYKINFSLAFINGFAIGTISVVKIDFIWFSRVTIIDALKTTALFSLLNVCQVSEESQDTGSFLTAFPGQRQDIGWKGAGI